jgi:hypothetical protein
LEEGDPALELGAPDGVDTFDSAINFAPMESKCFQSEITGGQFVMAAEVRRVLSAGRLLGANPGFYIETTAVMPDVCTPEDNFGLLFRSPDSTSGYLYGLSCVGQYSLKKVTGGSVTELTPLTTSKYILKGSGEINRLGVAAYDGSYYLFANGKYLATVYDYTYVQAGDLGYYVNAATAQPFVSRYNDLKVWTLEDAYYPSSAPPPEAPPVEPEPPASGLPSVTATTSVNIRNGPSTDFPAYGTAPAIPAPVIGSARWLNVITIPTTVSADGTG